MADKVWDSKTIKIKTGCGNLYVTITANKDKSISKVFAKLGKSGGCASAFLDPLGNYIRYTIKSGIPLDKVIKELKGCHCPQATDTAASCSDALGRALEIYIAPEPTDEPKP